MTRRERITPQPGQESVWDYPRPPALERTDERIEIELGGRVIASTTAGWRVLETSHPPTYYVPIDDFEVGVLREVPGQSFCEWKGVARYYDLVAGDVVATRAGWTYPTPTPGFEPLADTIAVMPGLVDRCTVAGETVLPQPGSFYGGWITSRVVGPFKGEPGTLGW